MNRRQFIRYSGGALVMAGGASMLYSLGSLRPLKGRPHLFLQQGWKRA